MQKKNLKKIKDFCKLFSKKFLMIVWILISSIYVVSGVTAMFWYCTTNTPDNLPPTPIQNSEEELSILPGQKPSYHPMYTYAYTPMYSPIFYYTLDTLESGEEEEDEVTDKEES